MRAADRVRSVRGVKRRHLLNSGEGFLLAAVITGIAWATAHPAWWVLLLVFAFWSAFGVIF